MLFVNVLSLVILISFAERCSSAPLDDYVNTPDPNFSWRRLQTYPQASYTLYVLNMTSQKWFDGKRSFKTEQSPHEEFASFCFFKNASQLNQSGGIIWRSQYLEIFDDHEPHSYWLAAETIPTGRQILLGSHVVLHFLINQSTYQQFSHSHGNDVGHNHRWT